MTLKDPSIRQLLSAYAKLKPDIKKRLAQFRLRLKDADEKLFSELSYCILTANANARKCDEAIRHLERRALLLKGRPHHIRPVLRGRARFHNKKADYIVLARELFKSGKRLDIRKRIDPKDIVSTRQWLVDNIKGFGYKEASHFLRNIGLGPDIAILDRHILKNLKRYGVIRKIPPSAGGRNIYLEIEEKMRLFSKKVKIPMDELDLLFWAMQTGFVFK